MQRSKKSRRKIQKAKSKPAPFLKPHFVLGARRTPAPASQAREAQCSAKSLPKGKFVRGVLLCRGYPSRAQGKKPRPTKLRAAGRTEGLGARRLNPHPLQKRKTQRMRHPQSRIAARLECGVRRKAEPPARKEASRWRIFMSWLKPRPTKNFERIVKTRTPSQTALRVLGQGGMRHPREFQACFKQTPVPRGRVVHPPAE